MMSSAGSSLLLPIHENVLHCWFRGYCQNRDFECTGCSPCKGQGCRDTSRILVVQAKGIGKRRWYPAGWSFFFFPATAFEEKSSSKGGGGGQEQDSGITSVKGL